MNKASTVVITGASAGVGRATARAFARRGCRIGLIARGEERLEATRREVQQLGGTAEWIAADVADPEAVERAAQRFEDRLGPVDIWVNSAMATIFSPIAKITPGEFRRVLEVTLLGQVYGTMAALRRMTQRDRGTIVSVGSALAWRAIPLQSAYCAAKHGVRAFLDSLRSELIHDRSHIRVTMVQMPALNTPQFDWARSRLSGKLQPVPPIFQPEVAARAILQAADQAPRELWVGRSSIIAILGSLFLGSYIDRKLATMGYAGQQTDERADRDRPDNLYSPVRGQFAAHGRFDKRSVDRGITVSQNTAERLLMGSVLALGATALALGGIQLNRRLAAR